MYRDQKHMLEAVWRTWKRTICRNNLANDPSEAPYYEGTIKDVMNMGHVMLVTYWFPDVTSLLVYSWCSIAESDRGWRPYIFHDILLFVGQLYQQMYPTFLLAEFLALFLPSLVVSLSFQHLLFVKQSAILGGIWNCPLRLAAYLHSLMVTYLIRCSCPWRRRSHPIVP